MPRCRKTNFGESPSQPRGQRERELAEISPKTGRSSPCGWRSWSELKIRIASGKKRKRLTEKTTALSRLEAGACRFVALEIASGVRAGKCESFIAFMEGERDDFQQAVEGGIEPAVNHVEGIS